MKYGEDMTNEIVKHLETGMGRVDSCILAGISYETFTEWMKKPEFSEAIKKAETRNKQRNAVIVQKAAEKSWQAAAWWLERKYRDEFAKRDEITGVGGQSLFEKIEFSTKQKGESDGRED